MRRCGAQIARSKPAMSALSWSSAPAALSAPTSCRLCCAPGGRCAPLRATERRWRPASGRNCVNRHAKGTPYRRPKRTPFWGALLRVVGGRWWWSGADGAVGKWPAGATVGRVWRRRATYPQRRREAVVLRCRVQARCLKRQLSLPVSTMSQWWVRRSSRAAVILASPNTLGQSPNARLVVTMIEVCS